MAYNKKDEFQAKIKYDPNSFSKKIKNIYNSLQYYYTPELIEDYKNHFSYEYNLLKYYFPKIDFIYEGRIKNKNSLEEKISRKLYQNKSGHIYDIFAKKIIIYSSEGCNDEQTLRTACYELANFLTKYTNSLNTISDKCKDYIESPKENGYQAIHILRNHLLENGEKRYCSEVQIRTFRMEQEQKFGTASHMISYKPKDTLKKELCPTYLEIGKSGKTHVLSEGNSFIKYKQDYDVIIEYYNNIQKRLKVYN